MLCLLPQFCLEACASPVCPWVPSNSLNIHRSSPFLYVFGNVTQDSYARIMIHILYTQRHKSMINTQGSFSNLADVEGCQFLLQIIMALAIFGFIFRFALRCSCYASHPTIPSMHLCLNSVFPLNHCCQKQYRALSHPIQARNKIKATNKRMVVILSASGVSSHSKFSFS